MANATEAAQRDSTQMQAWLAQPVETDSVAGFVAGPGIARLELRFDLAQLRAALTECLRREDFQGGMQEQGFAALPLTQRPGQTEWTENDLSGRYWLTRIMAKLEPFLFCRLVYFFRVHRR